VWCVHRALPVFGPQDAVIHNRCAKDVWFWHGEYGPAAFSLYHVLPPNTTGAPLVVPHSVQVFNLAMPFPCTSPSISL